MQRMLQNQGKKKKKKLVAGRVVERLVYDADRDDWNGVPPFLEASVPLFVSHALPKL